MNIITKIKKLYNGCPKTHDFKFDGISSRFAVKYCPKCGETKYNPKSWTRLF